MWRMVFAERRLQNRARLYIQHGRPGDWRHALRVVRWVKRLGESRADLPLLVTAAYIHDIGWYKILPETVKISLGELKQFEPLANSNSKTLAAKFLEDLGYSRTDIKTVNRLIRAADAHLSESDDEAILVDADNLSKLSMAHLREKYEPCEWGKMCDLWQREFPRRIRTETGRMLFRDLLKRLKNAIDNSIFPS